MMSKQTIKLKHAVEVVANPLALRLANTPRNTHGSTPRQHTHTHTHTHTHRALSREYKRGFLPTQQRSALLTLTHSSNTLNRFSQGKETTFSLLTTRQMKDCDHFMR